MTGLFGAGALRASLRVCFQCPSVDYAQYEVELSREGAETLTPRTGAPILLMLFNLKLLHTFQPAIFLECRKCHLSTQTNDALERI